MNSICTSSRWNTPEILEWTKKKFPLFNDPLWVIGYTAGTSINGEPKINIQLYNEKKPLSVQLATVYILPFVGHCGIRAIQGPSLYHLDTNSGKLRHQLEILWIKTIEAFLYKCEYSAIVASDGPSNTHRLLVQAGWHVWNPGINRRMGKTHHLYVMMKYLNNDEYSWLNLKDRSLLEESKPNPIIEKEVAQAYAQPVTTSNAARGF